VALCIISIALVVRKLRGVWEDVRTIKLILEKYRVSEKSLCVCERRVVENPMHAII
jgi:hypothetical protein